jgi:hypothetical protein
VFEDEGKVESDETIGSEEMTDSDEGAGSEEGASDDGLTTTEETTEDVSPQEPRRDIRPTVTIMGKTFFIYEILSFFYQNVTPLYEILWALSLLSAIKPVQKCIVSTNN